MVRWLVHLLALVAFAPGAYAVVNAYDPLGTTSAPSGTGFEPADPGFGYVGQVNGSSGVYLGYGWVLTANHVGAGTFSLGGQSYSYNGTDSHQINGVDLRLFKLSTLPSLSPLSIASSRAAINSEVVMVGAGRTPETNPPTTWHVDTDPDPWAWSTDPAFADADATFDGYTTVPGGRVVRWGTNRIEDYVPVQYGSYLETDMLETTFTSGGVNRTVFEAQAVTNDSGGALFVGSPSGWQLGGIFVTVGTYSGQPGGNRGANTAVFGNTTYAIDLTGHSDAINQWLLAPVPEPSMVLLILFLCVFGLRRRERRRDPLSCDQLR